ncbi:MAG: hypothetical protein A2V88_00380 [Elusimicrobia bacterium RBG_16_66_12]|nr:MAG: hypothetical protein A2V88_00380 [Elusimicrobia bacterium RBG_16_66_12]
MIFSGLFSAKRTKPLVLHIDDSSLIIAMTQGIIAQLGMDGISALDADSGIKLARERLPDLILMDTMMPGKDGCQAVLELKTDEKTRGIPIIMLTGSDQISSVEKALNHGASAYLVKPVVMERLKAKVDAVLKRAPEGPAAK